MKGGKNNVGHTKSRNRCSYWYGARHDKEPNVLKLYETK